MELMYPFVTIIGLIIGISIFLINFSKHRKYTKGKKVANTKYIKETEYYKTKMRKYKILSNLVKILSLANIVIASILISRPITVETKSEDRKNRDILLGLDISTSQSQVNLELIESFKKIIPSIKGDRIGIVIYNTAPMVYCPLTDDYEYIYKCFETLEPQLKISIASGEDNLPLTYKQGDEEIPMIWYGGVGADSNVRGSSLVGDGLAGTLYAFPDLKTDSERTRIIIFSTDNDVQGTETITLPEACELCKQYKINIYAYCPTVEMNSHTSDEKIENYRMAIEQNAKGKFYTGNLTQMAQNIVNEIKETKKSLLRTTKKIYITDHPEIFLISAVIIFSTLIIIEKRIKL